MSTAQSILFGYGALSVVYGMALGLPLSRIRMVQPHAPRHLVTAHLSALMQGAMHLGFGAAVGYTSLTSWLLDASAAVLALGSALFVGGATANWLMRVGDHFADRRLGFFLLSASAPLHLVGGCVIFAGVADAALRGSA